VFSFLMILLGQKRLRMTPFFADFVSESYSLFYYCIAEKCREAVFTIKLIS